MPLKIDHSLMKRLNFLQQSQWLTETTTSSELSYACCPLVSFKLYTPSYLHCSCWLLITVLVVFGDVFHPGESAEINWRVMTQNNLSHLVFIISVDLLALL